MAQSILLNNLNSFLRTARIILPRRICEDRTRKNSDAIPPVVDSKDDFVKEINIDLRYLDTAPDDSQKGKVVVMSHGAPGSHNDFKYIIPFLMEKQIRVLAPNYPGHGITEAPPLYRYSSDERAELVFGMIRNAELTRVDVLVSHSAGTFPILKLASDDRYYAVNGLPICSAVILVNPGGARPYKAIRPYWIWCLASKLTFGPFRRLALCLQFLFWRCFMRLRSVQNGETASAISHMVANIGFEKIPVLFHNLRQESTPRVLIIYAEDDPYVEKECSEEVAQLLGIHTGDRFIAVDPEDVTQALEYVQNWWIAPGGPKNAAVIFRKGFGGHYLQKFQAAFIAKCIEIITTQK